MREALLKEEVERLARERRITEKELQLQKAQVSWFHHPVSLLVSVRTDGNFSSIIYAVPP